MSEISKKQQQEQNDLGQRSLTELMDELKSIIDWFNAGDVDVEVASVKFDRGVQISEVIKNKLTETENKINEIKLKLQD